MIASWASTHLARGLDIGEQSSFSLEDAYDRYARLLFSVAYSVLADRTDAEDCVHDTLLAAWQKPRAYDAARGELKSFLVVAVRNAAISLLRKRARRKAIDENLPAQSESDSFEIPDYLEQSQLREALRALPADQLEVMRLGYFEYLTHVQIAQRLQLPLGTVKSRISLALRKLASAMPPRADA